MLTLIREKMKRAFKFEINECSQFTYYLNEISLERDRMGDSWTETRRAIDLLLRCNLGRWLNLVTGAGRTEEIEGCLRRLSESREIVDVSLKICLAFRGLLRKSAGLADRRVGASVVVIGIKGWG